MGCTKVLEMDELDQKLLVKCLNDARNDCIDKGIPTEDVNRLLKQFEMMQTMAKQLSGKKMKRFRKGGFPFGL